MKTFFFIFILSAFIHNGYAQTQHIGWLASFNTFTIKKPWSIHLDVQLRSTDQWKQTQTFLARTGLNYQFKPTQTATLGYAIIQNRRTILNASSLLTEHRIWQQYLLAQKWHLGKHIFNMSHRFRLEQRFLPVAVKNGNELEKTSADFAQRFRYFFRGIVPFSPVVSFQKGAFAALQNEVFLNVGNNDAVNNKVFDQNRFYAALGYRLNKAFDMEIGYMNQYVVGRGNASTNNHIFQLAFYTRL